MSLEIRPYAPGDEVAILDLFALAFGQPMSADHWRWRFLDNPALPGAPVIHLMWDGPKLAGHYAVSPMRMLIGGAEARGALSMTTMTHPDYRGRGIFTTLAESVYSELTASGYAMVYGFPNEASHYGFVRQLRWQDIYEVPLQTALQRPLPGDLIAEQLERVGTPEAELFAEGLDPSRTHVLRDAAYLNWRYVNQPGRTYAIFVCRGSARGAAVCKIYRPDDGPPLCDVVELAAGDKSATHALLRRVGDYAQQHGAQRLNAWMDPATETFGVLERYGFQHTTPITWLGFRPLADPQLGDRLTSYSAWHLSMGDSDVY